MCKHIMPFEKKGAMKMYRCIDTEILVGGKLKNILSNAISNCKGESRPSKSSNIVSGNDLILYIKKHTQDFAHTIQVIISDNNLSSIQGRK